MADYVNDVQELYVAYFGRPADPAGLAFWSEKLQDKVVSHDDIAAAFAQTGEYRAAYGHLDTRAVVQEVYDNLFSRPAEETGLNFWINALDTGAMTIDNMVTMVAMGAQGTDQFAFNAKVAVAEAFTDRIDTPQERAAYAGDASNSIAINYIAGVKDLISAAIARDPGNIDMAIARMSSPATAADEVQLVGVGDAGGVV